MSNLDTTSARTGWATEKNPYENVHLSCAPMLIRRRAEIIGREDYDALQAHLAAAFDFFAKAEAASPKTIREQLAQASAELADNPSSEDALKRTLELSSKLEKSSEVVSRGYEGKGNQIIAAKVLPLSLAALKNARALYVEECAAIHKSWDNISSVFHARGIPEKHPCERAMSYILKTFDDAESFYSDRQNATGAHGLASALHISGGRPAWSPFQF